VLVTLVCCYAACWGPTKMRGVGDVTRYRAAPWADRNGPSPFLAPAMAKAPLILATDETTMAYLGAPRATTRHYYFWFFGYVAKLPYERGVNVWDIHFLSGSSVAPVGFGSHPAAPIGIDID